MFDNDKGHFSPSPDKANQYLNHWCFSHIQLVNMILINEFRA